MLGIPCSIADVTESFSPFSGWLCIVPLLSFSDCVPGRISLAERQGVALSAPIGSVSFGLLLSRFPKTTFYLKSLADHTEGRRSACV